MLLKRDEDWYKYKLNTNWQQVTWKKFDIMYPYVWFKKKSHTCKVIYWLLFPDAFQKTTRPMKVQRCLISGTVWFHCTWHTDFLPKGIRAKRKPSRNIINTEKDLNLREKQCEIRIKSEEVFQLFKKIVDMILNILE